MKKWALRRSLSRYSFSVLMLAAWMVTSTLDFDRSLSSSLTVPENSLNRPLTRAKKCRMSNPTSVWLGSILYSVTSAWAATAVRASRQAATEAEMRGFTEGDSSQRGWDRAAAGRTRWDRWGARIAPPTLAYRVGNR